MSQQFDDLLVEIDGLSAEIEAINTKAIAAAHDATDHAADISSSDVMRIVHAYMHCVLTEYESRHFRTSHDTGANPNALIVWNMIRRQVDLPRLTKTDLERKHPPGAEFSDMEHAFRSLYGVRAERGAGDFMPSDPAWPSSADYPVDNHAYRTARQLQYKAWLMMRDALKGGA